MTGHVQTQQHPNHLSTYPDNMFWVGVQEPENMLWVRAAENMFCAREPDNLYNWSLNIYDAYYSRKNVWISCDAQGN